MRKFWTLKTVSFSKIYTKHKSEAQIVSKGSFDIDCLPNTRVVGDGSKTLKSQPDGNHVK